MRTFFFCLAIYCSVLNAQAQDIKVIQLKQEHATYAPKGYYISDVVDDRTGSGAIGTITETGGSKKLILQNGAAMAIKNYIEHSVTQNKTVQAVVLHIDKMDVAARSGAGEAKADIATGFSFYIAGQRVTEYSSKGGVRADGDVTNYIEEALRKAVDGDLKAFGDWWTQNKGTVVTSDIVKVNVVLAKTTDVPNAIVYSLQRPLAISDFTGPPPATGDEWAATSSGKTLGIAVEIKDGQFVVNVTIVPLFSKEESWFKEEGKNARVLAHEQAHFDITAIKVCELVKLIRSTAFTKENYESIIKEMSDQSVKEINEEQAAYDNETNHGIIEDKQIEWQTRLKQQVKAAGCY